MTAPETLEEVPVDEAVDNDLAEDELSPEQQELLEAGLLRCGQEQQPSMQALDLTQPIEWYGLEGSLHFMSIGGHDGLFDPATALFTPLDPESVRQLVVAKLEGERGAAELDVGGGRTRAVDWTSLQIISEGNGVLLANANSLPDTEGNVDELALRIDIDWDVTAEPLADSALGDIATLFEEAAGTGAAAADAAGDEEAGTAVTAEFLSGYYGDAAFPFDGRDFVLDWTTWAPDNTTDDGLVGSYLNADSDGTRYRVYAWYGEDTGVELAEAEPLAGDDDGGASGDDEDGGHGITAEYLGDYYGDDPLEFDGQNYVVDWTKWKPDQVLDDGRVGSSVPAVGSDGADYELYVWFDLENGAQVVEATPAEAEAGDAEDAGDEDEEFDARAHFDEVLVQELRDRWASNGSRLPDGSKDYDVSAWVNGDYGGELTFDSHDGTFFYATLTASTVEDEPKQVRCALRIEDADTVIVESEEVLS